MSMSGPGAHSGEPLDATLPPREDRAVGYLEVGWRDGQRGCWRALPGCIAAFYPDLGRFSTVNQAALLIGRTYHTAAACRGARL
jgi:hypothetical protein